MVHTPIQGVKADLNREGEPNLPAADDSRPLRIGRSRPCRGAGHGQAQRWCKSASLELVNAARAQQALRP